MLPALLDRLFEIATDPRVVSFFGFCLGLYILRDVARISLHLFASFRHPRNPPPDKPDPKTET